MLLKYESRNIININIKMIMPVLNYYYYYE